MTVGSIEGTPLAAPHDVTDTTRRGPSTPASTAPEKAAAKAVAGPAEKSNEPAAPAPRKVISLPDFPNYELSFQLDKERGRVVVRVIDSKSGTVVRSIPPEDLGKTLRRLPDARGLLLDSES